MFRSLKFLLALLLSGGLVAQKLAFKEKDLQFQNDSVLLSGTLIKPISESVSPAIVFLHGSGPMSRAGFRPYAEEFAKLGIASLFYDKRGTGSSQGSWITSSIEDLANDALSAVELLKEEDGIDPERIGVWGVSQAGWIASIMASKSPELGFMIIISGGGASPRESENFSYRKQLEREGLEKNEIEKGLVMVEQFFQYLSGEMERDTFLSQLDDVDDRLIFHKKQLINITPSTSNRVNWSWVADYDPANDIQQIKCPVLLLFGDKDQDQPTEQAVEKWKQGLASGGNDQTAIVVFPDAGHGIRLAGHHGNDHSRPPFADGYLELQLGWLLKNVINYKIE